MEKGYGRPGGTVENTKSEGRGTDDVPLVEKDLIKLMLLDSAFIRLPEDVEEEVRSWQRKVTRRSFSPEST